MSSLNSVSLLTLGGDGFLQFLTIVLLLPFFLMNGISLFLMTLVGCDLTLLWWLAFAVYAGYHMAVKDVTQGALMYSMIAMGSAMTMLNCDADRKVMEDLEMIVGKWDKK